MDFSKIDVIRHWSRFSVFVLIFVAISGWSFASERGAELGIFLDQPVPMSGEFEKNPDYTAEITEAQILHVTSDVKHGYTDIRLMLNQDGDIIGVRQYEDGKLKAEFSLENLLSGVLLSQESGHEILKIIGKAFEAHSGGEIDLIYLSNGIWDSHETFPMFLSRAGGHWALQTSDQSGHREFTQMLVKGKMLFGKVIGIEEIIVN